MEALQALLPLVITASLAALVVALGLDADPDDLLYLFKRPLLLAKAILAVNVAVPVAAALMISLFPLSPIVKAGIMLMAVSPVPALVPGKELKTGAQKAYCYGLYAALIVLAVVIVPVTVAILGRIYGREVSLPVATLARNVALSVLLPPAVGLLVRRLAPGFATRAAPAVRRIAMLLLVLAATPVIIAAWPAIIALVGNGTLAAVALVAAIALTAGHLLGGPDPQNRAALALTSATRHPGIAMMIVSVNQGDKHVAAAVLTFVLVSIVVAIPYQIWLKRRAQPGVAFG